VVLEQSQQARFLTSWILDSSGWIPDSISWIPDSKVVDSGFHRLRLPGFWIPDYLTWGEIRPNGLLSFPAVISNYCTVSP